VAGSEHVVLALDPAQEAARAVCLLDPSKRIAASREHLVGIRLVTDIPDQPIARRVEHVVQSDRQLDAPEASGKVPPDLRGNIDQKCTELVHDSR
jgi:hypothetical protein